MIASFEGRCESVVRSLGLCSAQAKITIERLSGGVASDIAVVRFGSEAVCVKFALSKLQVSDDWFAPVHRSKAEYSWLQVASQVAPNSAPRLHGWSASENGFAMEYLAGPDVYLWKTALLSGAPDNGEARSVADVIGRIHAASAGSCFDRTAFRNIADFESLRIDPYLRTTALRHPDLAGAITAVANQLANADAVLIHGDLSPKNILFRGQCPVILDAECATMGDAAFDVAFCLNHLILKSLHLPAQSKGLHQAVLRFWSAYAAHVKWEQLSALEARVSVLLPMLMLARIDGKSPVEYLSDSQREFVREVARKLIQMPANRLDGLLSVIAKGTQNV